jgi:predicted DNA-binding ribbon-helix-helix protein
LTRSKKYSVSLNGHNTSITLEPPFWQALNDISEREKKSITKIIEKIDAAQPENLSGAIRVFILSYFRK